MAMVPATAKCVAQQMLTGIWCSTPALHRPTYIFICGTKRPRGQEGSQPACRPEGCNLKRHVYRMKNLDFPQAPLRHRGLSEGVFDDTGGGGGGGADRSSLERLWGDELYEEDEEDIEENYMEGEIDSQEQGGDAIDDGEVIRSIRKECSNLTLRIESAEEEVKPRESIGRNQIQLHFSCGGPRLSSRNRYAKRMPSGKR